MRKLLPLLATAVVLILCSEPIVAESRSSALAASLSKEEQLLSPNSTITEADIARLQALTDEIRSADNPQLLSRAELMLVLFRERLRTKDSTAAFNSAIAREARRIRSDNWHRVKKGIVRTSFWIGMSSLGLFGVGQAVSGWATDQYLHTSSLSSATPYFITGKSAQLASLAGLIGAVGGLGAAWLLEVNPFDIPAVRTSSSPLRYPRSNMTDGEKLSYLQGAKKEYLKKEQRAKGARNVSFGFLAAGLTGVLATGIAGTLGELAYSKYLRAISATDAATYRSTVNVYRDITIGTAALALVGLSGATVGYLFGPDPAELSSSIDALDAQIALLQGQQ